MLVRMRDNCVYTHVAILHTVLYEGVCIPHLFTLYTVQLKGNLTHAYRSRLKIMGELVYNALQISAGTHNILGNLKHVGNL